MVPSSHSFNNLIHNLTTGPMKTEMLNALYFDKSQYLALPG